MAILEDMQKSLKSIRDDLEKVFKLMQDGDYERALEKAINAGINLDEVVDILEDYEEVVVIVRKKEETGVEVERG